MPCDQRRSRTMRSEKFWGCAFEGSLESGRHVDTPAGAHEEDGLDEIVAQDMTAEGWAPRQVREACCGRKRGGAYDRVVAPIVALVAMPEG